MLQALSIGHILDILLESNFNLLCVGYPYLQSNASLATPTMSERLARIEKGGRDKERCCWPHAEGHMKLFLDGNCLYFEWLIAAGQQKDGSKSLDRWHGKDSCVNAVYLWRSWLSTRKIYVDESYTVCFIRASGIQELQEKKGHRCDRSIG